MWDLRTRWTSLSSKLAKRGSISFLLKNQLWFPAQEWFIRRVPRDQISASRRNLWQCQACSKPGKGESQTASGSLTMFWQCESSTSSWLGLAGSKGRSGAVCVKNIYSSVVLWSPPIWTKPIRLWSLRGWSRYMEKQSFWLEGGGGVLDGEVELGVWTRFLVEVVCWVIITITLVMPEMFL